MLTFSDPVMLALIGVFTAGVAGLSAILQSWLTARNARKEKLEDYARQDQVAAAALTAAEKLQEKLDETSDESSKKLDTIHTLVNSSMTAAMQTTLESLKMQLPMMLEIIELKKKAGLEPSVDTLAAVKAIRAKISELETDIAKRIEAAASAASTVVATVAIVPGPTTETGEPVDTKKQVSE